jgi:hypothetical protein
MDSNSGLPGPRRAPDYSQLNDAQLRSAIRFAEKHLRSVEEGHVELLRAYREEIEAMRRELLDRVLRRMTTAALPLSEEQQRDLQRTLDRRHMQADEIASVVRSATKGRADRLEALTEIEAMALLLRLGRDA